MPAGINIYQTFSGVFEPALIEEIKKCPVADFSKNLEILSQGSYVKQIPLIVSGQLKVVRYDEKGHEILIYEIKPGESCILSLTACLTQNPSKANAFSDDKTMAILVTDSQVREWMNKYKTWRSFVMELYYSRLSELIDLFDAVAFKKVDERLIEKLKEKSMDGKEPVNITHRQLAEELGTAREVVSRLLKQLEKQNQVELSRGQIKFLPAL